MCEKDFGNPGEIFVTGPPHLRKIINGDQEAAILQPIFGIIVAPKRKRIERVGGEVRGSRAAAGRGSYPVLEHW